MKTGLFAVSLILSLQSALAQAGAPELRAALELLSGEIWTQTYEGFAFRERMLGHVEYGEVDTESMVRRLEAPANRAVAEQLESRVDYVDRQLHDGTMTVEEAARAALGLTPERVSGVTEFLPVPEPETSNFEANRQQFLAGGETREVLIYLRGEYRPFQASILSRLEALGFKVRPIYRDSTIVLAGHAPERNLRELSGIDGVDHLTATGRPYNPINRRPGLAQLDFRRGVKAPTL